MNRRPFDYQSKMHEDHYNCSFIITKEALDSFALFCRVDLQLSERTVKVHLCALNRYIKETGNSIDAKKIRIFLLKTKNNKTNPRTYRWLLCGIKRFCRDFLNKEEWTKTLKFPKIQPKLITHLPSRIDLNQFYEALPHTKAKALFLVYASSGLRKSEILNAEIKPSIRAIIPTNHEQYSTKNSYMSFYNSEAEDLLKQINYDLKVSEVSIRRWFKKGYLQTKIKITPQILREWFCSQMAKLNVPDRYVDAYCGRLPRSILAQRYTDYSIGTLKEIYDKANMTVLK